MTTTRYTIELSRQEVTQLVLALGNRIETAHARLDNETHEETVAYWTRQRQEAADLVSKLTDEVPF